MTGLVSFYDVDDNDPQYSEDQLHAAAFLSKMDWEGGITGLLFYSVDAFPEELRSQAHFVYQAINDLKTAVTDWAAERGIQD